MKKILFNTWTAAFFQKGGGEYQLLHSKAALEKMGYQIDLYNQWSPQIDFDIFHQFSIEPGVEKVVENYKRLGKKIALSTIMWNLVPIDHPEFKRISKLFHSADILLTNSNIESKRLSDFFSIPISKFFKTRNSITEEYMTLGDPELFRKKYHIDYNFVLCVANIDKRKNTALLVEACEKLNVPLITIGKVKDQDFFDSFSCSYDRYKHIDGFEDTELMKSAYRACEIFAMPSQCETPSIAAIEAASQGAKILITQEGSTKEYFKKHTHFIQPKDLNDITTKLQQSLKCKHLGQLEKYIIQNYTWTKTAEDINRAYNSIP